jgi:hypothetical protein
MPSSGMLRRVALLGTDVSEECNASINRVTRIGELGTTFLREPHDVTSPTMALTKEYNLMLTILEYNYGILFITYDLFT